MVRFQAIRSFASAGERATIDYLVTRRSETGVEVIAAAIGPQKLSETQKVCQAAHLSPRRIALRPLSAALLYLTQPKAKSATKVVLVDLLASDAEIVIAAQGQVIFVRTIRMPSSEPARGRAIAGEVKRSLFACGDDAKPDKVILWGKESVHQGDREILAQACGADVEMVDPFELAEVDPRRQKNFRCTAVVSHPWLDCCWLMKPTVSDWWIS